MENLAKNLSENMLEIRGLNFAYANGAGMLNNVNLSLKSSKISQNFKFSYRKVR